MRQAKAWAACAAILAVLAAAAGAVAVGEDKKCEPPREVGVPEDPASKDSTCSDPPPPPPQSPAPPCEYARACYPCYSCYPCLYVVDDAGSTVTTDDSGSPDANASAGTVFYPCDPCPVPLETGEAADANATAEPSGALIICPAEA